MMQIVVQSVPAKTFFSEESRQALLFFPVFRAERSRSCHPSDFCSSSKMSKKPLRRGLCKSSEVLLSAQSNNYFPAQELYAKKNWWNLVKLPSPENVSCRQSLHAGGELWIVKSCTRRVSSMTNSTVFKAALEQVRSQRRWMPPPKKE